MAKVSTSIASEAEAETKVSVSDVAWVPGHWNVIATTEGPNGTMRGPMRIDLPEKATEDDLIEHVRKRA